LLEGAIVVEGEPCELAYAEFVVDVNAGVDLFTAVAVGFKAGARFSEGSAGFAAGLAAGEAGS
jgi:hypothetical protein